MTTKYRADHVGSLLRPQAVLDAHAAYAKGELPLERVRAIEDEAILTALDLQRSVGLTIFTDGEYRRGGWAGDFVEAMDGYSRGEAPVSMGWSRRDVGEVMSLPSAMIVTDKLRQKRRLTEHETTFLRQHAPGDCKITMPAASYVVARGYKPGTTDKVYPTRADLYRDVVPVYQAEIQALLGEGFAYIQLDNPHYPDYLVDDRRAQWEALGINQDQALTEDIAFDNATIAGLKRPGVTFAMHLCRGNGGRAGFHSSGSYERIAEELFGTLDVDAFLLEYDDDRSGGLEPLRFVPKDKQVVLGFVTTKSGTLETKDEIIQRIEEAAKYVPLDNLSLSPQCGFASVEMGNPLSWDEQRRKLELVVETAKQVWG